VHWWQLHVRTHTCTHTHNRLWYKHTHTHTHTHSHTHTSCMCAQVEEVFAAGDLAVVASMLNSMRRSLSLVGDVPEFRAGRETLSNLEDRLQVCV